MVIKRAWVTTAFLLASWFPNPNACNNTYKLKYCLSDSIKYIFHLYPWVNWFAYHFTPGLKKTLTNWSISYWTISTFIHLKIIFLRFSPERKCNNFKPKYDGHNECHNECHQSSITYKEMKLRVKIFSVLLFSSTTINDNWYGGFFIC